jgi:hypothetical protein
MLEKFFPQARTIPVIVAATIHHLFQPFVYTNPKMNKKQIAAPK